MFDYDQAYQSFQESFLEMEDQDGIKKLLPNDEWGRTPQDPKWNPDKIIELSLEVERVDQKRMVPFGWMDVSIVPLIKEEEYRTVYRLKA